MATRLLSPTNQWLTLHEYPPDEIKREGVKVDVLAKFWDPKTDTFKFVRYVDCRWDWTDRQFRDRQGDLISEHGTRPAYFMLIEFPSIVD